LADSHSIPHISTGEILREAVTSQTPLGMKAQRYMERGELVPDQLVVDLIQERLDKPDTQSGWILDGFPRNVIQAQILDFILSKLSHDYDRVINLDVPDETLVARLLSRGRKDDNEEVIRRRLEVYRDQTAPLISYYESREKLVTVDGNQSMEAVSSALNNLA
jgi:adenylate kinase